MASRNPYLPEGMNHVFDLSDDPDIAEEQIAGQIDGWGRFLEDARNAPPGFFKSANWVSIGQNVADGLAQGIAEGNAAAEAAAAQMIADVEDATRMPDESD